MAVVSNNGTSGLMIAKIATDRLTWMGSIRCSLLMLECEEHLKIWWIEVWRSEWSMLWTTMTNPSTREALTEMCFYCMAKMGRCFVVLQVETRLCFQWYNAVQLLEVYILDTATSVKDSHNELM
jgi:hypothetical protein